MRELYGLQPNKCVYITIDTELNTTTNNHGIKIPNTPGYYTIPLHIVADNSNT